MLASLLTFVFFFLFVIIPIFGRRCNRHHKYFPNTRKKCNKSLDKWERPVYNYPCCLKNDAELCNGSTADSDSVCEGSNPSSAAIEVWLSLVERYVRDVEAGGSNPLTSTMRSVLIGFEYPTKDTPLFLFSKLGQRRFRRTPAVPGCTGALPCAG